MGHRFKTSHALLNTVSASALQIKQKTEKEGKNNETEREFKRNSRGNVRENVRGNVRENVRVNERENVRGNERENVRGNERERHRGGKKNMESQGESESK